MTAQPMHATGAAQTPAQATPTATPPTPEAARWAAYIEAHRPATRRRARRALLRRVLEKSAIVAILTGIALLLYVLPPDVGRPLAGTGVFGILAAFVWAMAWSARHARPAPPAQAAPWVPPRDVRPESERGNAGLIDAEANELVTSAEWYRRQAARQGAPPAAQ